MMIFEETTHSVFPADLYIQPGEQPVAGDENLGEEMCAYYIDIGIFAHEASVRTVVDRLEALDPSWMHAMHGGLLTRETILLSTRAVREPPFAYDGRLLGRVLMTPRQEEPGHAHTTDTRKPEAGP